MGLQLIGPRLAPSDTVVKREALFGFSDVGLVDTFDRTTSTTTLGSADTGQAWVTSEVGIVSNRMKGTASVAAGFPARIDYGTGGGNAIGSIVVRRGTGKGVGLGLRVTDVDNGLFALSNVGGTAVNLYKRVAGVNTSLGTVAVVWAESLAMSLSIIARNDYVKIALDGTVVLGITLSGADYTAFPNTLTKWAPYFSVGDNLTTYENLTIKGLT